MTPPKANLSFEAPPLIEVSFSVQFEPIKGFHIGFVGLLWDVFKSRYPIVETADELAHEIEKFGVISRKPQGIQFLERIPVPRVLFISRDQQLLVQIQKDRFVFNWRRVADNDTANYPRFPALKSMFLEEFEIFSRFLSDNSLEPVSLNQVELTYVNHIEAEGRAINEVFTDVVDESRFSSTLQLEAFSINLKHLMRQDNKNIGRLYTSIEKANRISDGRSVFVLKFVARTHPTESSVEGVVSSMEIMRQQINTCFASITTKAMHEEWRRQGSDQWEH